MNNRLATVKLLITSLLTAAVGACAGVGQSAIPAAQTALTPVGTARTGVKAGVRYRLVDLGTLGGPNSGVPQAFLAFNGETSVPAISAQGAAIATSDTPNSDPFCYFDDCFRAPSNIVAAM